MFGTSGIRGPVGEEVTAELALAVGRAVGVDAKRIVMGRDARESGTILADAFAAGVREVGADIVDLSLAATPTVARAVGWYDADAGCSITASHNPPEDNGLKLWQPDGQAFDADLRETIETRVREGVPSELRGWNEQGTRTTADATERHAETLVNATTIDSAPHVVVDLGNGAGGVTVDALVELGCHVETLNAQPDGRFPGRPSEPNAETLSSLCAIVAETDADLGIAHDGDADRAIFVDEQGTHIEGDAAFAALAAAELEPGDTTVSAVNVSQRLVDVVEEQGATLERTPIGSTNIVTRIQQLTAEGESVPIAGEGNGGVLFPEYRLSRDGAYTAARFCELLTDRTASEIVAEHAGYDNVRRNISYDTEVERERLLGAVEETARNADIPLDTTDGYRLDYDSSWVLVRPSGTEPLIRIYAEAEDHERAEELVAWIRGALLETV